MTTTPTDEQDRRRHTRQRAPVVATLVIHAPVPIAKVIDVSVGGVLLELPLGIEPPAMHASGVAQLSVGVSSVHRHARVVRVRWSGREKGTPMPSAIALSFDDADLETAMLWERMITA